MSPNGDLNPRSQPVNPNSTCIPSFGIYLAEIRTSAQVSESPVRYNHESNRAESRWNEGDIWTESLVGRDRKIGRRKTTDDKQVVRDTPFFVLFTALALKIEGNVYWGLACFSLSEFSSEFMIYRI